MNPVRVATAGVLVEVAPSRNNHGVQRPAYRHGHGKRLSETDDKIGTTSRNACPLSEGGPHLRHLNRHIEMGMPDTENGRPESKPLKTPADLDPASWALSFCDEYRKAG